MFRYNLSIDVDSFRENQATFSFYFSADYNCCNVKNHYKLLQTINFKMQKDHYHPCYLFG